MQAYGCQMEFLRTVSSNDVVWAVITGAALAASSYLSPSSSSGSLANRQAFVYGHYLDSKFKVLYNHQVLQYYCEGMLGGGFSHTHMPDGHLAPSLKPLNPEYKQLQTYISPRGEKVLFKNNFHHHVIKKLKLLSQSKMSLCC